MAIGKTFTDWPRTAVVGREWPRCSPALRALYTACADRYGVKSLGCYGVRTIRGGELESTHSFGAAIDLSYRYLNPEPVRTNLIGYLVGWSEEWGIGAIHDYMGSRIWRAGRTPFRDDACSKWWKAQRPAASGMGQSWADWLHVEVTMAGWHDERSEAERGIV